MQLLSLPRQALEQQLVLPPPEPQALAWVRLPEQEHR